MLSKSYLASIVTSEGNLTTTVTGNETRTINKEQDITVNQISQLHLQLHQSFKLHYRIFYIMVSNDVQSGGNNITWFWK